MNIFYIVAVFKYMLNTCYRRQNIVISYRIYVVQKRELGGPYKKSTILVTGVLFYGSVLFANDYCIGRSISMSTSTLSQI